MVAAALVACNSTPSEQAAKKAHAPLVDLADNLDAARKEFDAHKGEPRFLAVISPTCKTCQRGARAVRNNVLGATSARSLHSMIAWIPMLHDDERATADDASMKLNAPAVPQYWDSSQLLGKEVARSLGVTDWVAWDIYLFYPPEAEWTDHLPAPAAMLVQSNGVVAADKPGETGTGPAADQSRLPPNLKGKAEVVGDQTQFDTILGGLAANFGHRYPKPKPP